MKNNIIVIKIGSSVLFTQRGMIDEFRINAIIDQIEILQNQGRKIILVVSGAVAYGSIYYRSRGRESDSLVLNLNKQVLAGVGQVLLMSKLLNIFTQKGFLIAQILLTRDDFVSQKKKLESTLVGMVRAGIIPILNENDVLDLHSFGGNDLLAAEVALRLGARLIILSTMEKSTWGVGGGYTKQTALDKMHSFHLDADIVDGKKGNCILEGIHI